VWSQRGELQHVSEELLISPFVMHDIDTSRSALLGAAFKVERRITLRRSDGTAMFA
jgi:hypothetical protein